MLYFRESSHMEAAYGFSITIAMLMTTFLMFYYMKFVRKWHIIIISMILLIFLTVELSFFVANVAKIKQRWMFLIFEFGIIGVMYTWYRAKKIKNRYVELVRLETYIPMIQSLSQDKLIPKLINHLVYMTGSDSSKEIEHKIIYSIFSKIPKRADIYWFVHIHTADDPYRSEYKVTHIIPNGIIWIEFNLGFRIEPQINFMFQKVVKELTKNKEVNIQSSYDSGDKSNAIGDFQFIVMEKYLSSDNELPFFERLIMRFHFRLKKMSLSEERGFGLDPTNLTVEQFPLMVSPIPNLWLKRVEPHS
jgi:KUP system potassium uptake protein